MNKKVNNFLWKKSNGKTASLLLINLTQLYWYCRKLFFFFTLNQIQRFTPFVLDWSSRWNLITSAVLHYFWPIKCLGISILDEAERLLSKKKKSKSLIVPACTYGIGIARMRPKEYYFSSYLRFCEPLGIVAKSNLHRCLIILGVWITLRHFSLMTDICWSDKFYFFYEHSFFVLLFDEMPSANHDICDKRKS